MQFRIISNSLNLFTSENVREKRQSHLTYARFSIGCCSGCVITFNINLMFLTLLIWFRAGFLHAGRKLTQHLLGEFPEGLIVKSHIFGGNNFLGMLRNSFFNFLRLLYGLVFHMYVINFSRRISYLD